METLRKNLALIAIISSVALVVVLILIGLFIVNDPQGRAIVINRGFDLATLVISGILAKVVLGTTEIQKETNEEN